MNWTEVFAPYLRLYAPEALPDRPWWTQTRTQRDYILRRSDRTWEVAMDYHASGSLRVRRLDLEILDDADQADALARRLDLMPAGTPLAPTVMRQPLLVSATDSSMVVGHHLGLADIHATAHQVGVKIDTEFPLARPDVWPGQLWLDDVGRTVFIDRMGHVPVSTELVALLYGPSIHGRDVPWART